jgi:hypothetical protein
MSFSFNTNKISTGNSDNRWKARKSSNPKLPLYYKDKLSQKKPSKLVMLLKGFLVSVVFYALYYTAANSRTTLVKSNKWTTRQEEVKKVFLESWHDYEAHGWGKDVYHPITQAGENMGPKPLGWMIVDSLDTLILMKADDELERAKKWVKDDLDYRIDYNVNVFETTIRMLGGLLSAYHFKEDDVYLDKAVDLANALLGGFASDSGIPYASVNLETGEGVQSHTDGGASSTAEVATLQLEFKYLALLTGEVLFWKKAEKVMQVLESNKPKDGLVPIHVNPSTGKYQGSVIRLGSRGDSYYEYLLKQYLQTNKKEEVYWDMYRESVEGVKKHLVRKSGPSKLTFIGELELGLGGAFSPKMDHLVCFYGGLLALGATNGISVKEARKLPDWTAEKESDFKLGEELTYTCYKMYKDVKTGLAPEIVVFNEKTDAESDFYIKPLDRHNLQRPETVESLFYLYRLTGDVKYREYGYEIFQSFVKHGRHVNSNGEVSYTSLDDVTTIPPQTRDNTESFWFAETLKYLYLLFDDSNLVPLDKYVFNTEAHPFPRFDLTETLKTNWRRMVPNKEPSVQEPQIKIDKNNPPEAKPADKPVMEEVKEVVKEHPAAAKDAKEENKAKMNDYLKDLTK